MDINNSFYTAVIDSRPIFWVNLMKKMCASKIQILSILLRSSKHCSVWRWNCMYLYKHIDNLPNMILNVATLNNTIINRSVDIDSYRLKVAHTSNTHLVSHILKMR